MSLEAKFEALKMDDVSSVVDAVKKDGPQKSGLAAGIAVLLARCASTDDADAIAACSTVKALVEQCPSSHAFTKECLTACTYPPTLFFLHSILDFFSWLLWLLVESVVDRFVVLVVAVLDLLPYASRSRLKWHSYRLSLQMTREDEDCYSNLDRSLVES
jgi:hypothetical protein